MKQSVNYRDPGSPGSLRRFTPKSGPQDLDPLICTKSTSVEAKRGQRKDGKSDQSRKEIKCCNEAEVKIIFSGFECDIEQDIGQGSGGDNEYGDVTHHLKAACSFMKAGDRFGGTADEFGYYAETVKFEPSLSQDAAKISPIPSGVKQTIKRMYGAGVTRPKEIMEVLVEDGVTEEGSFTMKQLYNYLGEMKKKMTREEAKAKRRALISVLVLSDMRSEAARSKLNAKSPGTM